MSKAKTALALPTLAEIAAVEYDRTLSTREDQVYHVASQTTLGRRYKVVLHEADGSARCECTAAGFGNACHHTLYARTMAEALWWERELHAANPAELRSLLPTKRQQVRLDVDALSAHGCLLAIDALLLAAGDEEEAA